MGRLTRDPEVRYTSNNNTLVCSFTLAVTRSFKREGQPDADFVNIVAWSKTGEFCSKYFTKGQQVAVIGDANTALQYSLLLSSYCKKVYVYTLFDKFFGDASLVKALRAKENIEVRPNTSVIDFIGENELEAIEYKDKDGNILRHEIPAVFVAIGQVPDNKAFANVVDFDANGYIIADVSCKTKTEGLFVAGDCRTKAVRQVSTAIADGAIAATNASIYLESLN